MDKFCSIFALHITLVVHQGCPSFEIPQNGRLDPTKDWYDPGDIVTLFCDQGFDVVGDAAVVCSSAQTWHGEIPKCSSNTQGMYGQLRDLTSLKLLPTFIKIKCNLIQE